MVSDMRYLIFMMGIFAFYNGWIYNEFFAIPLEVFGSCYSEEVTVFTSVMYQNNETVWLPSTYGYEKIGKVTECIYTFGMDPRWF